MSSMPQTTTTMVVVVGQVGEWPSDPENNYKSCVVTIVVVTPSHCHRADLAHASATEMKSESQDINEVITR